MENIEQAIWEKGLREMVKRSAKAAEIIKNHKGVVRIISHYDADGISSAAIIASALERLGKPFRLSIFRQLEEPFIRELSKEREEAYIISDMGSGQLGLINELMKEKTVIICDHHQMQGEPDSDNIVNINSLEMGIGESMSGAGVSYILARAFDSKNTDLSELAIIGAIGDSQIDSVGENWGLNGMNREILKDAESSGKVAVKRGLRLWGRYSRALHKALEYTIDPFIPGVSGSEKSAVDFLNRLGIPLKNTEGRFRTIEDLSEEEQKKLAAGIIAARIDEDKDKPDDIFGDVYELLERKDEFRDASEFATMLNSCGKTGKASIGVRLCMSDETAYAEVKKVVLDYRKSIGAGVRWVQAQADKGSPAIFSGLGVYVKAGKNIPEDIISNVMSIVNHSHIFEEGKPLFGLAEGEDSIKVSARVDKSTMGGPINLKEIVSSVAKACGGEGGGHASAAGARIPRGSEDEFISLAENELKNLNITNTINEDNDSAHIADSEIYNNIIIEDENSVHINGSKADA